MRIHGFADKIKRQHRRRTPRKTSADAKKNEENEHDTTKTMLQPRAKQGDENTVRPRNRETEPIAVIRPRRVIDEHVEFPPWRITYIYYVSSLPQPIFVAEQEDDMFNVNFAGASDRLFDSVLGEGVIDSLSRQFEKQRIKAIEKLDKYCEEGAVSFEKKLELAKQIMRMENPFDRLKKEWNRLFGDLYGAVNGLETYKLASAQMLEPIKCPRCGSQDVKSAGVCLPSELRFNMQCQHCGEEFGVRVLKRREKTWGDTIYKWEYCEKI